jgi:hypothetical protein
MTQIVSFEDFQPSARYDGLPWTEVRIGEGTTVDGPFTLIDTIALSPVDPNPALPAYRNFTTNNASDTADLWYQLTFFDAAGAFAQPTYPVQNTAEDRPIYASVSELATVLKLTSQVAARGAALRRVLESASTEIDSEIGTADIMGTALPYGSPPALVSEVCLERAVEHWQQMQSPFGIIGMGDLGATYTARDSWDRHAHKLSVLKASWGLA